MNRYRDRIRRGVWARPYVPPMEEGPDTTPDPFEFDDVADAEPATLYTSNVIVIAGIDAEASLAISMSGGVGQYSKNGGAWSSSLGAVVAGDTVQIRVTSAATAATAVTATLTIGSVSAAFVVTTADAGQLDFSDPDNSGFIPL